MLMRTTLTALFSLAVTGTTVLAHPTEHTLQARTVWSPPITAPDAQTVWEVGKEAIVRW